MSINRKPYQLVSREWQPEDTIINIGETKIGGSNFAIIAGPCAIENEQQVSTICDFLAKCGVTMVRGGAFKPRSSPYAFQGLKEEGLMLLKKAAEKNQQKIVTEVMEVATIPLVVKYADMLQVGTRNMQNYPLLKALGKIDKPILLKRGMSSTIEEWLLAAEYILSGGNKQVILCERGIRTFNQDTRNTLDLGSLALVKTLTHLPVIADPSQGTGVRDLVIPMSKAAMAAGSDGLIIEIHNHPENALSDGEQSLYFDQFKTLLEQVKNYARIEHRNLQLNNNTEDITI